MIVGRDTAQLSEEEVLAAAVETVAENASDGILAPLLWAAVLGPVGGMLLLGTGGSALALLPPLCLLIASFYLYHQTQPAATEV